MSIFGDSFQALLTDSQLIQSKFKNRPSFFWLLGLALISVVRVAILRGSSELWVGDELGTKSLIGEIGVEVGGSLHGLNQEEQRFGFRFVQGLMSGIVLVTVSAALNMCFNQAMR